MNPTQTIPDVMLPCPRCKCDRTVRESLTTRNGKVIILACSHMIDETPITPSPAKQDETLAGTSELEKQLQDSLSLVKSRFTKEETDKEQQARTISELTRNLKEFTCCFCFQTKPITTFIASGDANEIRFRLQCGHLNRISVNGLIEREPAKQESKPPQREPIAPIVPEKPIAAKERDERWNDFFDYQKEGIEFVENSGIRALIGDEPGLGKTIQAIGVLRYNSEITLPACIICPAGVIYNWQREFKRWFNDRFKTVEYAPLVHLNGTGSMIDGQLIHIVSSSLVSRPGVLEAIKEYGFKTLIIDESHQFKTPQQASQTSQRTEAMMDIVASIPHKILLSGTSILNRTMEYYNSLYMIRPEQWPSKKWLESYCEFDYRGRNIGMHRHRRQKFFDLTKDYIIRRMKKDVLADLPEKSVHYTFIPVNANDKFVRGYNNVLDELEDKLNSMREDTGQTVQIIALMAKLRHLTGLAKVRQLADRVKEFLENTDDEKICIGTHHKMVMEMFQSLLAEYEPICISDESPKTKDDRSNEFRDNPKRRVMIASILGCGIGRNLQFCPNVLVAEREWNRAMEYQFEGRFERVGMKAGVTIDYYMANETIDEFFHELVLLKGTMSEDAMNKNFEAEPGFMRELAQKVVKKRMKYVGGM